MTKTNIIKLDLPADYEYLHLVDESIATILEQANDLLESEMVIHDIQLAAHEVYTNIVRHAYSQQSQGRIEVTFILQTSPRRFIANFQDNGLSFNPAAVPKPNLSQLQEGGFGLFIIRKLMDEVSYCSNSGGNCWQLIKKL